MKGADANTLLFGHFSFGAHRLFRDRSPQYATVLRQPVDRVVSLYHHHLRIGNTALHELLNREKYTIEDFVSACVSPETNNEMVRALSASSHPLPLVMDRLNNFAWQLTRGLPTRQIDENWRLRCAIRNVADYFLHVGISENLPPTERFVERWLGLPPDAISVGWDNVFEGDKTVLTDKERLVIEKANRLDLELYRHFSSPAET